MFNDLIMTLIKLESPSYEVDLQIMKIMKFADENCKTDGGSKYVCKGSNYAQPILPYTSSIDYALKLIPEGWRLSYLRNYSEEFYCELENKKNNDKTSEVIFHKVASIAILIAIFRLKSFLK